MILRRIENPETSAHMIPRLIWPERMRIASNTFVFQDEWQVGECF